MATLYRSTRDASANSISSSQAVLQGISPDGGLFVPVDFPKLDLDLSQLPSLSYQELAYKILQPFFSDFTEDELRYCVHASPLPMVVILLVRKLLLFPIMLAIFTLNYFTVLQLLLKMLLCNYCPTY